MVIQDDLAAYRDLRIDHATISAAEVAQRELAAAGQHRVSLPDLMIGACAQQHGAGVLARGPPLRRARRDVRLPQHPSAIAHPRPGERRAGPRGSR